MSTVKKDTSITPVSIAKQRKKLTSYGFDPDRDVIFIHYDVIMMDASNVEIYTVSKNNVIEIPQSRFTEPLISACVQATKDMIQNEF